MHRSVTGNFPKWFQRVVGQRAATCLCAAAVLALPATATWARSKSVTLQVAGAKPPPPGAGWSPNRATGAPDAKAGSDDANAWASALADGGPEWIELAFAGPIKATAVHLHQQFNPGAVLRVEAVQPEGPRTLWSGVDTLQKTMWRIDLSEAVQVDRLRIHLDTRRVPGWNEIDAVGVLDAAGQVHWAQSAKASSHYGQPMPPSGPATLVGQRVRVSLARGDVMGVLVRDDGEFLEISRPGQTSIFVARAAVQTIEGLDPPALD
jgi:hypothetical protein